VPPTPPIPPLLTELIPPPPLLVDVIVAALDVIPPDPVLEAPTDWVVSSNPLPQPHASADADTTTIERSIRFMFAS
jgi:hypothetical protein